MAPIRLHKNARTTPAIRREIQQSTLSERALARKYVRGHRARHLRRHRPACVARKYAARASS